MKRLTLSLALLLVVTSTGLTQEVQTVPADKENLSGFQWLKQFEGEWKTESKSPGVGDQPASTSSGTMKSRVLGELWVVNEYDGSVGDFHFNAVQTIGYDKVKKQYKVTWVDSFLDYTWRYSGTLDATGKRLTMDAEGPDMSDPTKTRKYRDIFEIKSETKFLTLSQMMNDEGQWATISKGNMTKVIKSESKTSVLPFLMFVGKAEEAMDFYKTVFPGLKIVNMEKYKAGGSGKEGDIKLAIMEIAGQQVMCTDSPIKHDFDFTPSFSFFVECENEAQLKERFAKLSDGGKVMIPVNNYGFSKQFGWASDKFGVSWQLNLQLNTN